MDEVIFKTFNINKDNIGQTRVYDKDSVLEAFEIFKEKVDEGKALGEDASFYNIPMGTEYFKRYSTIDLTNVKFKILSIGAEVNEDTIKIYGTIKWIKDVDQLPRGFTFGLRGIQRTDQDKSVHLVRMITFDLLEEKDNEDDKDDE